MTSTNRHQFFLKIMRDIQNYYWLIFAVALTLLSGALVAQTTSSGKLISGKLIDVGMARIDITPDGPIRLAGYGARKKTESEGVIHPLNAKALAFGNDRERPSILITVDLLGIPGHVTQNLVEQLSKKLRIEASQVLICASHTHGGPELGNTLNILQYRGDSFSDSLLAVDHLIRITQYTSQLSVKLEQVALAALNDRRPSLVSWGQGQAGFGKNRRAQGGPVDPALPVLRVTDPDGKARAVLVNYACHGTTLGGDVNQVHGDWIGEAQKIIETNHPGMMAMVAIGCGADTNPNPRGTMEHVRMYGQEIANNVDKLLTSPLEPLNAAPVGSIKWVKLPFAHIPDVAELIALTSDQSVKGYYARLALERIARGQTIPHELLYPVQVWTFGDDLAMVNLAGEVVVDYSVRLKNIFGAEKLWVNAYANDAPCYIASRRVIREGGYEAESSMWYYDKPSPFVEDVEDIIVNAVNDLMPDAFKVGRDTVNHPRIVRSQGNGSLLLKAEYAHAIGNNIRYMPEWKAFGWFNDTDQVVWDVEVNDKGQYDVYLEWSVSDEESGKPFVLAVNGKKLQGRVEKTGSWLTYKKQRIGRLAIPAGSHKVIFRHAAAAKGSLLDLRAITLVPVKH